MKELFHLKIYRTEDWHARPPKALARRSQAIYIVIHHTATANTENHDLKADMKLARAIQNYHMDTNKWDDSGHNFLNTREGRILEGRHGTLDAIEEGQSIVSAHAANKEANASPGIENEGTYSIESMPDCQWQSLILLCSYLCQKLNLNPDSIKGHRDFKATACPGDQLYSRLPALRLEVGQRLKLNNESFYGV